MVNSTRAASARPATGAKRKTSVPISSASCATGRAYSRMDVKAVNTRYRVREVSWARTLIKMVIYERDE